MGEERGSEREANERKDFAFSNCQTPSPSLLKVAPVKDFFCLSCFLFLFCFNAVYSKTPDLWHLNCQNLSHQLGMEDSSRLGGDCFTKI